MLDTLHIENIVVIEKADIAFAPGLNVLTGETGAGKSIVIDAIGAVLGGRTPRELVRTGTDSAAVTAVFSGCGGSVSAWLQENGIETENDELFLSRRITADGKNTCRINGTPVPVAMLRELGSLLLDIHGQNDGRRLLDEKNHRAYLDGFGRLEAEFSAFAARYGQYRETVREMEALQMDEGERARRMDTLEYQIAELERAEIRPGELEEKKARRDLLKNAEKFMSAVDEAFQDLYGGSGDGAVTRIENAERSVSAAARYSEELRSIGERLTDLKYNAADIAEQLRDFRENAEFSPEELDELDGRLDQLRRLSRKYGGSEEEMLAYLERCRAELADMSFATDKLAHLEAEREKRLRAAEEAAERLSAGRKAAARVLEERIRKELSELAMKGVQFEASVSEAPLSGTGKDDVAFLMSANAGEKPGRISRIASGGELARIMLAMKNVLAASEEIGAMVFDEVDTGVSGVAAQRVGEKLAALAGEKQVICVTHLPQIAVMADCHFAIEKSQENGRTYTHVRPLDLAGRMREIARLTGGENVTDLTLRSAQEQLEAAAAYKKRG